MLLRQLYYIVVLHYKLTVLRCNIYHTQVVGHAVYTGKSVSCGLRSEQFIQNNLSSGLPLLGNTHYFSISCLDGTQQQLYKH